MKKVSIPLRKGKLTQSQRVALALAFVGEHKEEFKKWIESKGGKIEDE